VLVIVGIVGRGGRMEDEARLDIVAHDERRGPRSIVRRMTGKEVVEPCMKICGARIEASTAMTGPSLQRCARTEY
jgi:hypothetical protein